MEMSRKLAGVYYDNLIGLNPRTWSLNLMQTVSNTIPELGLWYTLRGFKALVSDKAARQRFHDTGLLLDRPGMESGIRFEGLARTALHGGMAVGEYVNRGIAYLGALEQAKDQGMVGEAAEQHALDVVDKTQFSYGAESESSVMAHLPPDMRVFQTFKLKETEYVRNLIADAYHEYKDQGLGGREQNKLASFLVINAGIPALLTAAGVHVTRMFIELWDLMPLLQIRTYELANRALRWGKAAWRGMAEEFLGEKYPKGIQTIKPGKIPADIITGLYDAFFPAANFTQQAGKATGLIESRK
jgi:hypothetical protein